MTTSHRLRTPWLILIPLLAVVAVAAAVWWRQPKTATAQATPQPVPVAVARAEQRDVPRVVRTVGTVQSMHSVVIRSQIDGVLTELLFQEGQQVNKGDLLARIDDRAIRAQLAQARAEKRRNEAELRSVRRELERAQRLLAAKAVSRQEYDQLEARVEQLEATLSANDAAIAAAEVQLSYTRIVSPVSGQAGMRRVDVGNLVRSSDGNGLVSITQIDPIDVVFHLSQDWLPRLTALGGRAPVTVFDRGGGTELASGELSVIDNQVDQTTGTIRLKARFANAERRLWPGQSVAVALTTELLRDAVVVPAKAVRQGLAQRFVFRVDDGRARVAPVQVAFEDDDIAVIAAGVAAGDLVVTDGHARLRDGSAVRIAAPASEAAP